MITQFFDMCVCTFVFFYYLLLLLLLLLLFFILFIYLFDGKF